jgi:hypothetical protein
MTLCGYGGGVSIWQNKNPTAGLAVGFDKSLETNQNPTTTPVSVLSSRLRFRLRFTPIDCSAVACGSIETFGVVVLLFCAGALIPFQ